MKHSFFCLVIAFTTLSYGNDEPSLIIRADKHKPKGLPTWSKMPSASPVCNASGVSIKFSSLFGGEKLHPAVSLIQKNTEAQSIPFRSDISIGDLFLTDQNSVLFSLNYRGGTEGVFALDANGELNKIVLPADFPQTIAISRPSILSGKTLFRSLNKEGLHVIYHGFKPIYKEQENTAYLYLPTVKENQMVFKIGMGKPGQVNPKNPDKILSVTDNIETVVATDQDLDETSDFLSFDNSPIPDGNGGVVFIAEHVHHGRSLWLYKNKVYNLIFKSSLSEGKLEHFSPSVNKYGDVVFRVIKNARRAVLLWNNTSKKTEKILEQGQHLITNEDNIKVIDRKSWPAFSGKPCITDTKELYIHAVLENSKTLENKGSGVFRATF